MANENNFNENSEDYDDNWVSKSSKKRQAHNLRDIGISIMNLSDSEFDRISFEDDDSLKNALLVARTMKPRSEELRREVLHIEALLRTRSDEDIERYKNCLVSISGIKVAGNAVTYNIEKLRDSLISGGIKAINDLVAQNVEIDRQKLRSLVSKAKKELENEGSDKKAYKELFQYLKNFSIK